MRSVHFAALATFLVAIALRSWIGLSGFFYDDGMIVLRVAANLARGYGFGYNVGEHVQAATSLLWALLSALIWKISPDSSFTVMRALGVFFDSMAAAGLVVMMTASSARGAEVHYSRREVTAAIIAGLFYATASTSALAAPSGLETGLYTFTIVLSFLALNMSWIRSSVLLSILLVVVRPDGVLVAGVLAMEVFRSHRRNLRFATFSYSLCGVLYVAAVHMYFRAILPQTVIAKGLFQRSVEEEWLTIVHHFFFGSAAPSGVFVLLGAVQILRRRPELRPILCWSALYVFCFATFSEWWPWYLPPIVLTYAICLGIGVELVVEQIIIAVGHYGMRMWLGFVTALLISSLTSVLTMRKVPVMAAAQRMRLDRGRRVAALITETTSGSDTIMLEPLGIIGFYTPRIFYDYPGLASPRTTEVLRSLGREVSRVPDNPDTVRVILSKVRPNILVLRQHEYEADEAGDALSTCRLYATVESPFPSDAPENLPSLCGDCNATMYLLRCNS